MCSSATRIAPASSPTFASRRSRRATARGPAPCSWTESGGVSGRSSCREPAPALDETSLPHWNGWGVNIRQHRFQPAEQAQLAPDDVPRLKLKWSFGFPGDVRADAQPTVFGGRLFVGSAGGKVYALDAKTGCQRWMFDAGFGVRTAITIGEDARGTTAYFGDQRGYAYALDADTGKLLWKQRVEEHQAARITGALVLTDGVLYVPVSSLEEALAADPRYSCCTFRGLIAALAVVALIVSVAEFDLMRPALHPLSPKLHNQADHTS